MRRTSWILALLVVLDVFNAHALVAQRTPDSAWALVKGAIARDTDPMNRFMHGQALWRSGYWQIDGEFKSSTGVFYKATGHWAFVLSTGLLATSNPNAVLALYLEPYSGGQSTWLGASLNCEIQVTPTPSGPAHCLVAEGATALLDINFSVEPGVFFRFQDLTVTLTEPDDKDPARRWTARSISRGRLRLIPEDSTSDWR